MFKRHIKTSFASLFMVLVMALSVISITPAETKAAIGPFSAQFTLNEYEEAELSWNEVNGASKYVIYKAGGRFATFSVYAETTDLKYTDEDYDYGDYYKVEAVTPEGKAMTGAISYEIETFGSNTYIFDEDDDKDSVQKVMDSVYTTSEAGQFDSRRFAFMFKPSAKKYDVKAKVGFYTQVAGMGISPKDTTISQIECKAEWMKGRKYDGSINYSALCNFWRSVENLTTPATDTIWAVSQATAMRRMNFVGSSKVVRYRDSKTKKLVEYTDPNYGWLYLHQEGGYASGGFLADSKIATMVSSGSQQQWLSRNVETGVSKHNPTDGDYQSAVWNNVLVGCRTSVKESNWPRGNDTVVEKTPVIAEKPFLAYDDAFGGYGVVVPSVSRDTQGVSWEGGYDYEFIDIDNTLVVKPSMTAQEINAAIEDEDPFAIVFAPGIYNISEEIHIPDTISAVLGLGYATLKPNSGNRAMFVEDANDLRIAGLLFDAGAKESETLLTVGEENCKDRHDENPMVISDCFFRVGGADLNPGKVKTCVVINANDVVCDNFWVWRADHGAGVGWDKNTADTGVIFNGQNITAYGLMVEHFQKNQTIWNNDDGRCYMYQSELPYDIKSQSVWNQPGSYGYTDYVVSNNVKTHQGFGIGIYSCYQKAQCYCESAIQCPTAPGIKFTNALSYSLVGNGSIDHVINKEGYGVMASGDMARLVSYINGKGDTGTSETAARKPIYRAKYNSDIDNMVYTGKEFRPITDLYYGGVKLRPGVDYNMTYSNNKEIGKATIKLVGLGTFRDDDTVTFKIVPGKVKLKSVKATKKKVKIKFNKVLGAKKYEIAYAYKSNFKGKKTKTISKTKYTLKRKNKKAMYIKVRAFKKVGKTKFYGSYSKKKKIKKVK